MISLLANVTSRNSNLNTSKLTKIVGRIPETKEPSQSLPPTASETWLLLTHICFLTRFFACNLIHRHFFEFSEVNGTDSPVEGSTSDGFSCDVSTPVCIS